MLLYLLFKYGFINVMVFILNNRHTNLRCNNDKHF